MNIEIKIIKYGFPEYSQEVKLREKILRNPLGLKLDMDELIKEKNQVHIVALENNEVIGCVILCLGKNNKTAKLRQMAVSELYQGKQIGNKLLEFAESYAKKANISKIVLHARKEALNFYLKNNYKITSDEFIEVTIPHFEMQKTLA